MICIRTGICHAAKFKLKQLILGTDSPNLMLALSFPLYGIVFVHWCVLLYLNCGSSIKSHVCIE